MTNRTFISRSLCLAMVAVGCLLSTAQAEISTRFSRGTLTLTSDNFGDNLAIIGFGSNQVAVISNGGLPLLYGDVQNIKIIMKRGLDEVAVGGIEISGNLDIDLGGDFGDNVLVEGCLIGGNFTCKGASDSTTVDVVVGRNMRIDAGTPFDLNGDGATMLVANCEVAGKTDLNGSRQSFDVIAVVDNFFSNNLTVKLNSGIDTLAIGGNLIGGNLSLDAGSGIDTLAAGENLAGGRTTLRNFEIFSDLAIQASLAMN